MCNVTHTCQNCLNAYNNIHVVQVCCCNKEFDAQSDPSVDCFVRADESCGRWSQRRRNQPPLDFHRFIQLSLFD